MSFIKNSFIRNKLRFLPAVILIAMAALAGCSKNDTVTNSTPGTGGTGGGANTADVVMQNMAFVPASITVTAGTTVKWTNKDSFQHTVTSGTPEAPDGKFDSGLISQNGTFSYKFDTKGTYNYFCKPHQQVMKATVTVQ
ncbi:MAG: plastocyanin/azurin family copper-binding protein [Syntrophomonadaceae bacterium]